MTIRSIFKAGESDREKELMRKIDKIGAETILEEMYEDLQKRPTLVVQEKAKA